jgi:hypothetical protein
VKEEETLEILAFMEASDWCKTSNGAPVFLEDVFRTAYEEAAKFKIN